MRYEELSRKPEPCMSMASPSQKVVFIPISPSSPFHRFSSSLSLLFLHFVCSSPCLVVVDDLDSLCPHGDAGMGDTRQKAVACLQVQLDDLSMHPPPRRVIVLATANHIDRVSPRLRCPGRFEKEVELPVPSSKDRVKVRIHFVCTNT